MIFGMFNDVILDAENLAFGNISFWFLPLFLIVHIRKYKNNTHYLKSFVTEETVNLQFLIIYRTV